MSMDHQAAAAAQEVGRRRERSRSKTKPARSTTHRTHLLRSYMACGLCERRFWGATCRGHTYYLCRPPKDYVPAGHPQSIWVREDTLLKGVTDFFENDVLGPQRRERLSTIVSEADQRAAADHQTAIEVIRRSIADITARRARLVNSLELLDDPDPGFVRDVQIRAAELNADREAKTTKLAELEAARPPRQCPDLLTHLPSGRIGLADLPEPLLRSLFDAFRLEMRYDLETNTVHAQVTLTRETLPGQQKAASAILNAGRPDPPDHDRSGACGEPRIGFEPMTCCLQDSCSGRLS